MLFRSFLASVATGNPGGVELVDDVAFIGGVTLDRFDLSDPSTPTPLPGLPGTGFLLRYDKIIHALSFFSNTEAILSVSDPLNAISTPVTRGPETNGTTAAAHASGHVYSYVFSGDLTVYPAHCPMITVDAPDTGSGASGLRLSAARPNPFVAGTTILFSLPTRSEARVTVHDVTGRRVRTLRTGVLPAGPHETRWDGRDGSGHAVGAGVYFVRLEHGDRSVARKIVRLSGR